jgi:hypothetical protein
VADLAELGLDLASGEVARSRVVFQPLLARTHISREERSGSKCSGSSLRARAASIEISGDKRMRVRRWLSVKVVPGKRIEDEERDVDVDAVDGFTCGMESISSCRTSSSFLIDLDDNAGQTIVIAGE